MPGDLTGSNYVDNPSYMEEYSTIQVMSVDNGEITIPSRGTTDTDGWTFLWSFNLDTEAGGFTGNSWLLNNENANPLKNSGLYTDDAVAEYLRDHGNLDLVFQNWHPSAAEFAQFLGQFDGQYKNCARN